MSTCPEHEEMKESIKSVESMIQFLKEWQSRDEERQDQTEKMLQELRTDLKTDLSAVNAILKDLAVKQQDLTPWLAHYTLKDCILEEFSKIKYDAESRDMRLYNRVERGEDEIRRWTLKMLSVGMVGASLVIAFTSYLLGLGL